MDNGSAEAELIAVLTAVTHAQPKVMTVGAGHALPSGPFVSSHRSLQAGLRDWIERQTGHPVGFLEQLYTFADRDRDPDLPETSRKISISYLGLVHEQAAPGSEQPEWHGWYEYFPWEDHRAGAPTCLSDIISALLAWGEADTDRRQRIAHAFGLGPVGWDEDLVLQRYELMYEAGFSEDFGRPMGGDHRRILATGMARLRAKIKYRAVAFELMPESFTLLHLQRTVEAMIGMSLHKSNFRRQIDQQNLIEETGEMDGEGRGRPAMLYRYRAEILQARALAGTRLPINRN